ncbi:hypothetical protein [Pseudonocardia charpentierae]|uniref:DUF4469 domain-containing protein n=1 Tax=Pseudonocardia charpentierae TaxID=3075545 RepID=A0ABU2NJ07_9PSEU|nr:hypothetical protein [Pseudonocardia sp. DSM 45834]MDT0353960.1 hypothetical protein [Pseudonocardia sp. DSM 45834]
MALQQLLLDGRPVAAGEERRLLPMIDLSAYAQLHFHISDRIQPIGGIAVRVVFGTPAPGTILLADSVAPIAQTSTPRAREYEVPAECDSTGIIISVPVVAPMLYDVVLTNRSPTARSQLYVAVFAHTAPRHDPVPAPV